MSDLPKSVHIMEVGPRDGLQIEPKTLPAADKVKMIEALADAGLPEIEVGSFVNPRAVPQMADSEDVIAGLARREGVQYRALWLNARGLERALAHGNKLDIDGKLTLTASETFIKRNTIRSIEDTFAQMPEWIALYRNAGIEASTLGLMAAFGCNFEGYIPEEKVLALVERTAKVMDEHGGRLRQLSLADTMGWGNPQQTKRLVGKVRDKFPEVEIKLHLHDTRGQAVANAVAAMEMGVRVFDSAVGGLGGCPFAGHKGAAGNVCTEDLVFSCEEMGIETGIDLDALAETARMVEDMVGHPLPGKVMKGGSLNRYKAH
ncbi:MAG: hydroxymethylglutaryl-CoA lyase [Alphaproteobacteria bacterium]